MRRLLVLLCVAWASPAAASTYYVATTGTNAWPGCSQVSPCLTIDYVADRVAAGDTIRVAAGSYAERVTPAVTGTEGNVITFLAVGAVTACGFDISGKNYLRIIGFVLDADAGCVATYGVVTVTGTNYALEFWHNTFQDGVYNGIRMGVDDVLHNAVIIGNTVTRVGVGSGSGVAMSIRGSHNLVAYNTATYVYPDAFALAGEYSRYLNNYTNNLSERDGGHPDVYQSGSHTLGLSHNLFEGLFQEGGGTDGNEHTAQISHTQADLTYCPEGCGVMTNNVFRRSVFHNTGSGTIGINQADDGTITGTRVYHNTTALANRASTSVTSSLTFYSVTNPVGGSVFNNIDYQGWSDNVTANVKSYSLDGTLVHDYNLAYDPDGSVTFTTPFSAQAHGQGNIDPDFVGVATDDFTLGATSGAIGTAGPLTTVTTGNGTGTTFSVTTDGGAFFRGDDAALAQYSGALVVGDTITVGTDVRIIASIAGDAITVTEAFTWAQNDPVYFGSDTTPDIGAYPYKAGGFTLTATYSVTEGTATVTPNDASLVRFVVCYDDGVPTAVDNASPYTCATGSGTFTVRVFPLFASKTTSVLAWTGSPTAPTGVRIR